MTLVKIAHHDVMGLTLWDWVVLVDTVDDGLHEWASGQANKWLGAVSAVEDCIKKMRV